MPKRKTQDFSGKILHVNLSMIIMKVRYIIFLVYKYLLGKMALELILDFLEFFKMDYTMSVFSHESNLKEAAKRDELLKNLGIKGENNKPALFQIINALKNPSALNKENQYLFFFLF